jgi:hypothetical protein
MNTIRLASKPTNSVSCSFGLCTGVNLYGVKAITDHALEVHGCCYQEPLPSSNRAPNKMLYSWQCRACYCIFNPEKHKGFRRRALLLQHFKTAHQAYTPEDIIYNTINTTVPHKINRVETARSKTMSELEVDRGVSSVKKVVQEDVDNLIEEMAKKVWGF